jgi:subtilisin family serine protease
VRVPRIGAVTQGPGVIGADKLWGANLETAGNGIKIGIIDEGVDQTHPFLSPAGFTMPAGYPKGDTAFTTAKVIVARAFAPPSPTWKYASLPFDPQYSEHGTHVAGIAAGDHNTKATAFAGQPTVSGVAPAAYIGNYKALTIPTPGFGLDGNAPEIAKAVEQAVADGMDVINLSLGEPEIEPSRDIVVKAIDGAALAGVVPAIAAGNDGADYGRGSVGSPGSAARAITSAASTTGRGFPADIIASFSSVGPTPYSLQLKPDVTAPGVSVLSSVPAREGTWATYSGTSMASPHIAGSAALLKQQHPTWTVAQIKSALMLTGDPAYGDEARAKEATPLQEGGGRVYLPRANAPLVFASPSSISFGLLKPGESKTITVALSDAGGGAGPWTVSLALAQGTRPTVSPAATVPGTLDVTAAVGAGATEGDGTGFVVLTRGLDTRRIPYWLHVERPALAKAVKTLTKNGTYDGYTSKGKANVSFYRYPEGINLAPLAGPEQVFALRLSKPAANFGVRIVSQRRGVKISPRVVRANDENRVTGYVGLPGDLNPYRDTFGREVPVVGAILPAAGTYGLVFDTGSASSAGKFTFRVWINDVTPPVVKLKGYAKGIVSLGISDPGSGADPSTLHGYVDGAEKASRIKNGKVLISSGALAKGKHAVRVVVSDFQESKNMEDVLKILPNTRDYKAVLVLK